MLTTFQQRILQALADENQWMSRKEIGAAIRARLGVATGYTKGYAAAMGAATKEDVADESLEGLGYVEHRNAKNASMHRVLEYRITAEGRKAIQGNASHLDSAARLR